MQGRIGKAGWLSLTLAAMGAGCLYLAANDHELEPEQVAMRSEGIVDGSLRWSFDADNAEGSPLEAVFYTLECTPRQTEHAVDVVVRLYETPADGRRKLRRTGERGSQNAEFDLVCSVSDIGTAAPCTSYHISFCGRNLGTWKNCPKSPLAARKGCEPVPAAIHRAILPPASAIPPGFNT